MFEYEKNNKIKWQSRVVLFFGLGIASIITLLMVIFSAYFFVEPSLPNAERIREIPLETPLRIYSRDGRLIDEVGVRKRINISYEDMPQHLINAFVAAEDQRFFDHSGIDYRGILRAAFRMISTGRISGGGSTLTQQLAREYFLNRKVMFTRKVLEVFLAYKIEQEFTKKEIMTFYANKVYFGQRAYGVAAAAQVFFGKNIQDISLSEAATLAGVLPAPSNYNPVRNSTLARIRRSYVLNRMYDLNFIDEESYKASKDSPLISKLHGTSNELSAPYVAEMVRIEMINKYGGNVTREGFKVFTTIDSGIQRDSNYGLQKGLLEYTQRHGYRGPIGKIENSVNNLQQLSLTDLLLEMEKYPNPNVLEVAVVTKLNPDNSANIILRSGEQSSLLWNTIRWAKPYIDGQNTGPNPKTIEDVLTTGDVIYIMPITIGGYALSQLPIAQGAVVSIDPFDGAITSLSGGFDYSLNKFNHVTQGSRQPGSAFKPFIYSAALEQGNTAATIILDAPVVLPSSELEKNWRPSNYTGRFYGEQRLREALVRSLNLASVRLLLDNTGITNAINHIQPFGFKKDSLPLNGGLALGAGSATPLDMAQAYAVFANGGYIVKPHIIDHIRTIDDEVIYRNNAPVVCRKCELTPDHKKILESEMDKNSFIQDSDEKMYISLSKMSEVAETYQPDANQAPELFQDIKLAKRIISEQNAFLMRDIMRDVIRRGTGVRAWRVLGRERNLSGKTGTTNDRRDTWFAGFSGNISAVVWVGNDDNKPLGSGEQGSRTALPIWIEAVRNAWNGTSDYQLPMPKGMISVSISRITGCPADASTDIKDIIFEIFREDHLPTCKDREELRDIFSTKISH